MKLLTTKKERAIVMESLRPVTKREKIIFPVAVTLIVAFIVPDATPLVGMLMLGNLFRESGVVDRLVKTASNELMNIITIMLGTVVGATATAENFLTVKTLMIVALGLIVRADSAFFVCTSPLNPCFLIVFCLILIHALLSFLQKFIQMCVRPVLPDHSHCDIYVLLSCQTL